MNNIIKYIGVDFNNEEIYFNENNIKRFLTKDEIDTFNMKMTSKKYNL